MFKKLKTLYYKIRYSVKSSRLIIPTDELEYHLIKTIPDIMQVNRNKNKPFYTYYKIGDPNKANSVVSIKICNQKHFIKSIIKNIL